jgi:peptidoglycan LD-endopeptidase LytH
MRRVRTLSLILVVVALVGGPFGATAQDLDVERDRVRGLEAELNELTHRSEELIGEIEGLVAQIEDLDHEERRLEQLANDLDERLGDRVRQVYKQGSGSTMEALLAAEGPNEGVERAGFFLLIQDRETAGLEDATAVRLRLAQTRELLLEREQQLEARSAELEVAQREIEGELDAAAATVSVLEELAARQRTIDRGTQQGVYACPLHPGVTHFIDSWGFPRSGGRSHQGTDIMGPMGSPVYAFTGGVISRHSNSRLGGISLYLRGDDGSTYFYTHLQGYAEAGAVGNRVEAGEHIAYNGDTGNARGGAPHIHFERHPGGGSAVNPYPYLAAACF